MQQKAVLPVALLAAIGVTAMVWRLSHPPVESHGDDEVARESEAPEAPPAPAPGLMGVEQPKKPTRDEPEMPAAKADGSDAPSTGVSPGTLLVKVTGRGAPLAGAAVRFGASDDPRPSKTAKTNVDGIARFEGVERDGAAVEVLAEGFEPKRHQGEYVVVGSDREFEVDLGPGVPFDGRVVDAKTGAPIAGATVLLTVWSWRFALDPTDAQGRFHVSGVKDDSVANLNLEEEGFVACSLSVRIDGGTPKPAEPVLRLERGGALVGTVVSTEGQPVAGANVYVWEKDEESNNANSGKESPADLVRHFENASEGTPNGLQTASEKDGTFRIGGLKFGATYQATATSRGHASALPVPGIHVSPTASQAKVTLALRRPATVLVQLTVPSGLPHAAGQRVRLSQPGFSSIAQDGIDDDGRYRFGSLAPGRTIAFAEAAGFSPAVLEIDLREGATAEVELVLETGASVEGIVGDDAGQPLSGAEVEVASAKENESSRGRYLTHAQETRTDPAGRFSISGLASGPAVLVARWSDWGTHRWLSTRGRVLLTVPGPALHVVLARQGGARARLVTAKGVPFAGEVSKMLWAGDSGGGSTDDVKDGILEESNLDPGDAVWVIRAKDFAWIRRPFTVREGVIEDLGDLLLDRGVVVTGRVIDTAGRPVADADLECVDVEERQTRTDAKGSFTFDHFPREPFSLNIAAKGFMAGVLDVEPSKMTGLEVHLLRPATVRGVFKTAAGALVKDERIALRRPDAILRHGEEPGGDGKPVAFDYYDDEEYLDGDASGHLQGIVSPGRWIGYWHDEATRKDVRVGEWTFVEGENREIEIVLPAK